MMSIVFIETIFPFFTVGKIYPAHKLDRHRVSIRDDDGDRISSDTYDLLFEVTDEIHVDFTGGCHITVGKLYPVMKHPRGIEVALCDGVTYNVKLLDLLVEIEE